MAVSINEDLCVSCGVCVDACPSGLLELGDAAVQLTDADACVDCGACVDECAVEALSL